MRKVRGHFDQESQAGFLTGVSTRIPVAEYLFRNSSGPVALPNVSWVNCKHPLRIVAVSEFHCANFSVCRRRTRHHKHQPAMLRAHSEQSVTARPKSLHPPTASATHRPSFVLLRLPCRLPDFSDLRRRQGTKRCHLSEPVAAHLADRTKWLQRPVALT